MIDGGAETLEQQLIAYLLSRESTTPAEFADHFHLSDRSAAYWLGCLVKSGRLRIAMIQKHPFDHPVDMPAAEEALRERLGRSTLEAVLEIAKESVAPWDRSVSESKLTPL